MFYPGGLVIQLRKPNPNRSATDMLRRLIYPEQFKSL